MRTTIKVLRMLVRLLGTVNLVLGLLFWSGNAFPMIPIHMLIGLLFVLCLWAIALLVARAGEQIPLVAIAIAWGLVVPIVGMTQDSLVPGDLHWIIRVLHLLLGLGALTLAEMLAGRYAAGRTGLRRATA